MTGEAGRPGPGADRVPAIVIGGPTASGKSEAAVALAEALGGTVVNADSMQVYQELRVVTARPDDATTARAPHRLFGVLSVSERCSVGRWRAMAEAEIDRAWSAGSVPIVVGGTGLYLRALLEGLAEMPDVPAAVARHGAGLLAEHGAAAFHALLAELDPAAAASIRPSDPQRLLRAWSVVTHTGRSIRGWQADTPLAPRHTFYTLLLLPDREAVYAACDGRFARMVEAGAVEEVAALLAMTLDPSLPAMKAVGVPEIAAFLEGRLDRGAMIEAGQRATRRYAKRQFTWLRHQLSADQTVNAQFSESLLERIFPKIRQFLLTHGT